MEFFNNFLLASIFVEALQDIGFHSLSLIKSETNLLRAMLAQKSMSGKND